MTAKAWTGLPFLDALRPEPRWRTDFAVLASYSADLVAVAATLLALAGLDDDRGSGSKVDFANALETVSGRVAVLVQAGRIHVPNPAPKIMGVLDQFIKEVAMDQERGSWHPKIALVRHVNDHAPTSEWRLWLGSRNLSRDMSWDLGLALKGQAGGEGRPIPGVPELAEELFSRAALEGVPTRKSVAELAQVHWQMPDGVVVEEVRLLLDGARSVPPEPEAIRRLTVVSPYLDGAVVGALGRWGQERTPRMLMSTISELGKLANHRSTPLSGYTELLYLDTPTADEDMAGLTRDGTTAASDDELVDQRGLHAKLIFAEHAAGRTLWVGSANATTRGWHGPNAEVVATLSVTPQVAAGLDEFVSGAQIASRDALVKPEESAVDERLGSAQNQVSARWGVQQCLTSISLTMRSATVLPHPDDPEIELDVAPLGQSLVHWPRNQTLIEWPLPQPYELTQLVHCRLRLDEGSVEWLQRASLDPPIGPERDHSALARFLDPRTFLLWIRSLLDGAALGDGGGDWDAAYERGDKPAASVGPEWWAPTLEEALTAWTKNPQVLAEIDRKVQRYLRLMARGNGFDVSQAESQVLQEFRLTWDVLRSGLLGGPR